VVRQQQWRRPAAALFLFAAFALAQAPPESQMPAATMKQIMLDLIHPASNEILLVINRGGPKDEKDWAAVRHSAITLEEAGALLLRRARFSRVGEGRQIAGRRRRRRVQGCPEQRRRGARRRGCAPRSILHRLP